MESLFLSVMQMSLAASYVILFVIVVRLLLKKAPKVFTYALWAVVLLRLLCPFAFESSLGLLPVTLTESSIVAELTDDYIGETHIYTDATAGYDTAVGNGRTPIDTGMGGYYVVTAADGISAPDTMLPVYTSIWLIGIALMLLCSMVRLVRLKRQLVGAVPLGENIYLADHISSPFVMGFIRPKIYLPSATDESEQSFVISHERCHVRRLDHITRILAFAALTLHWFNPLVWLAFILSGKDMEMSCDEAVMKKMDTDIRAEYAQSLLRFATGKKLIAAIPLAFGEGDTKARVQNVMKYKRPVLWVSAIALAVIAVVAVGLMGNRKEAQTKPPTLYAYYEYGVVPMNLGTYMWDGVVADAIPYTEMDYDQVVLYNEGLGHRNANLFFSTSNEPANFNSDNAKGTDTFEIVEMKRYVDGKEETLTDFDRNMILVSLETDNTYLYSFKVRFGEYYGHYSIKINNNVDPASPAPPPNAQDAQEKAGLIEQLMQSPEGLKNDERIVYTDYTDSPDRQPLVNSFIRSVQAQQPAGFIGYMLGGTIPVVYEMTYTPSNGVKLITYSDELGQEESVVTDIYEHRFFYHFTDHKELYFSIPKTDFAFVEKTPIEGYIAGESLTSDGITLTPKSAEQAISTAIEADTVMAAYFADTNRKGINLYGEIIPASFTTDAAADMRGKIVDAVVIMGARYYTVEVYQNEEAMNEGLFSEMYSVAADSTNVFMISMVGGELIPIGYKDVQHVVSGQ